MTHAEFAAEHGISMNVEAVNSNPNMPDWHEANHYKVTLKRGKKRMTVHYSQGFGITHDPQVNDVLNTLALDASGIENARDFEDWCGEYGYDTDSRKAERTYKACQQAAAKLKRFMGDELYNVLLWETEEA